MVLTAVTVSLEEGQSERSGGSSCCWGELHQETVRGVFQFQTWPLHVSGVNILFCEYFIFKCLNAW